MEKHIDRKNLRARLNRVIGQLNAIQGMIDKDARCEDLMIQVHAADSALHKIGFIILEGHLSHCVRDGIESGRADETIANFLAAMKQYEGIK